MQGHHGEFHVVGFFCCYCFFFSPFIFLPTAALSLALAFLFVPHIDRSQFHFLLPSVKRSHLIVWEQTQTHVVTRIQADIIAE